MGNLLLVGLFFILLIGSGIFFLLYIAYQKRRINRCFVSIDDQGTIRDGSDNFFDLIKFKREEILESNFLDKVVHPKDIEKIAEGGKLIPDSAIKKGSFLFRLIDRNGTPTWIKALSISASNERGENIFRIEFDFDSDWVNLLTTLEKESLLNTVF